MERQLLLVDQSLDDVVSGYLTKTVGSLYPVALGGAALEPELPVIRYQDFYGRSNQTRAASGLSGVLLRLLSNVAPSTQTLSGGAMLSLVSRDAPNRAGLDAVDRLMMIEGFHAAYLSYVRSQGSLEGGAPAFGSGRGVLLNNALRAYYRVNGFGMIPDQADTGETDQQRAANRMAIKDTLLNHDLYVHDFDNIQRAPCHGPSSFLT